MKKTSIYRILFFLHLFVGVGAIAGGLAAITNPLEPLGVPAVHLKNSPFTNYFIPGIILFTVIGIGNIVSAFTFRFKSKYQGYISSIFSWALMIWIVVQCIMLNGIAALHVIYFIIGLIEASLSMFMLFEYKLFPTNFVIDIYNKTKV